MKRTSLALALLGLAACGPAAPALEPPPPPPPALPAPPPPLAIDDDPQAAARIASDVTYLASQALAGRGTGEEGARLAADFIVQRFKELKLEPYGRRDGDKEPGYLQAFQARVGAKAEPPVVELSGKARQPAVVADGSASGTVEGRAVFVGYGITAPAADWDDYAGADLSGKIAIVLDGVPAPKDKPPGESPLRDFGSVRYKLRTAREHKAAGAIILRRAGEPLPPPPADASSMGIPGVVLESQGGIAYFPGLKTGDDGIRFPPKARKPVDARVGSVKITTKIVPVEAEAWNVVGLLPGRADSPKHDEVVVVGAHYDHLGKEGGRFSRAPGVRASHPGADDNASGAALMLEVARRFSSLPRPPERSVLFMAFGAEEIGAIGSRYWVEHPTLPLDHVVAMLNADMVGRLRDDRLIVDGVGTSPGWKPLVDAAAEGLGFSLAFGAEGFGASDHSSFTAMRIPVAFFFTGVHPDYHMPSDTADKINAPGEERVATLASRLALGLATQESRLAFTDAPADPHRGMRGGFKVSLGTIPDYGFSGKGVRLDGVRPDAPAARAGLARGDVIVKVGPHDIGNIHDYMFALGDLEPGRKVVIEVDREGKRIPLEVIPAPGR